MWCEFQPSRTTWGPEMAQTWPSGTPAASDNDFRTLIVKATLIPNKKGTFGVQPGPLGGRKWPKLGHLDHPQTLILEHISVNTEYYWYLRLEWFRLNSKNTFLLGINVALVKFALKSISEAKDCPDGQVWVISGAHVVRYGPEWTPSILFIGYQFCFSEICPTIDIWGLGWSRWPSLGHFRPPHGPIWSGLNSKHPFLIGYQCCFSEICPKIDIWGWGWSRLPSFSHFRPPCGPTRLKLKPNDQN